MAKQRISRYDDELRMFTEELLRFESTHGNEAEVQTWVEQQLAELGFETYSWESNPDDLATLPGFPDGADLIVENRPSVGGVFEFGDPDAGRTLVLNGHVDVVPVDEPSWDTDPFEPTADGDRLIARGAADMKSGFAACVFAARSVADRADDLGLDGRLVVESVAGEEEGGIGAAASAHFNPYPFERDAVLVAEPTELGVVTAIEGNLMTELRLTGRSAHAATRWRGKSVLPHFERVRRAFENLEAERHDRVTHPLYDEYPISWPVNIGVVEAGSWTSSVPAHLTAQLRIGVAPGETLTEVEDAFEARLDEVVTDSEWLSDHPPTFERQGIQFESAETSLDAEIVTTLQTAMADYGLVDTEPYGVTYGADARHYTNAGIPTVTFGPGSIKQAHFPNEYIDWPEVETAAEIIADTAQRFLTCEET
jgi:acetylornithine deacetylase